MLEQICGWIQDISVYLVVTAAVMHAIPGKDYGKYIRFFSGLILILLVAAPLLNLTGMQQTFDTLYKGNEYEMEKEEIERAAQLYESSLLSDIIPDDVEERIAEEQNAGTGEADATVQDAGAGEDGSAPEQRGKADRIEVGEIEIGQ